MRQFNSPCIWKEKVSDKVSAIPTTEFIFYPPCRLDQQYQTIYHAIAIHQIPPGPVPPPLSLHSAQYIRLPQRQARSRLFSRSI